MPKASGFIPPREADGQIAQIRSFALTTFRAESSVFYWIDDLEKMAVADLAGPCVRHFERYITGMKAYDPLNVERLVTSQKRVATMRHDRGLAPRNDFERYESYMHDSAFTDVIDFVFWRGGVPFAGLGILKTEDDPPIDGEVLRLAASIQPYIEFNLADHPRPRTLRRHRRLGAVHGLTPREIEVAELVSGGLTNQDIAEVLGIGLGTVKTHVLRVFQKLEVTNRTMLSAHLADIDGTPGAGAAGF